MKKKKNEIYKNKVPWKSFVTIIDGQNQLGIAIISLHGKVSNKSWILEKIYKATLPKIWCGEEESKTIVC